MINWHTYRHITFLALFTLHVSASIYAQNRTTTDSLIRVIETQDLSLEDLFKNYRVIAHDHYDKSMALEYAHMAIDVAIQLDNQSFLAKAYEELAVAERLLGNNSKSLKAALTAFEIFEKLDDKEAMAATMVQLGSNQVSDGNYEEAILNLKDAIALYNNLNDRSVRFGFTLVNLGEAFRLDGQLDSAKFYFQKALSFNESLSNKIIEGYARGNLGMALRSNGELTQAKPELVRANEILTELGDPYSVSVYTADLAQISMAEGKPVLAEEQLLRAYNMAKEEGLKEQIRDFSEMLVNFYEGKGDYPKALDYQKVYQVYQDSLVNKENVQQIERLKANYEIDKREGQIDLLEDLTDSQRAFNLALGGSLLIFGIFAALLYQSNKQKREANAMLGRQQVIVTRREEEKAVLLKELNHRVKNNLQMVSSLLNLQRNQLGDHPAAEAINAGKLRVEALSMIHQKLYQDDVHTSIHIKEHLELLVSNLMYSYGDPFNPKISVQPNTLEMDIDTAIPLSLIVNELVTNAMKYAYEGIANPEMDISLVKHNRHHLLDFTDNGIGIDPDKDTSNSFGIRLIKSLVAQLNGTLEVTDVPSGGTRWIIELNNQAD